MISSMEEGGVEFTILICSDSLKTISYITYCKVHVLAVDRRHPDQPSVSLPRLLFGLLGVRRPLLALFLRLPAHRRRALVSHAEGHSSVGDA